MNLYQMAGFAGEFSLCDIHILCMFAYWGFIPFSFLGGGGGGGGSYSPSFLKVAFLF